MTRHGVARRTPAIFTVGLALVGSLPAQSRPGKIDPLLRPLLDRAVVARLEAAPRLELAAEAIGRLEPRVLVLSRPPGLPTTYVDAFVSLTDREPAPIEAVGAEVRARIGSLIGARVPVAALATLAADPRVRALHAAHRAEPENDFAMADIRADRLRTRTGSTFTGATGRGVILGFVDTGIDWAHDDFKNPDGSTRILFIWDQTTAGGTPPGVVAGQVFSFGDECDARRIDTGTCPQRDTDGHGSHVAGIAAGDGSATGGGQPAFQYTGAAPHADIVAVKTTFSTVDIIAGIQYIFKRAELLGRPAVVNLSLGTQFGPHDGTDPMEQAIDSLSGPGRVVTKSAGNAGSNQNSITAQQQRLRHIHATRTISPGDTAQVILNIPAYSPLTGTQNDFALLALWYDGMDTVTVTVTRPDNTTVSRRTGQAAELSDDTQGAVFIDNASAGPAPQNGDHQAEIQIFDNVEARPPTPGEWRITVRLDHRGGSGRFDAWLYSQSSALLQAGVRFGTGGDNGYVVSSPGNAARALTVAAHTSRESWEALSGSAIAFTVHSRVGDLAPFSSSGPTRPIRGAPSRQKPDLSAPGTAIFSTLSGAVGASAQFVALDGVHRILQGTSMSAPMTAGTVALLLERDPGLTPEGVREILTGSARADAFTTTSFAGFGGGRPNPSWGYGKLDAEAALALVAGTQPVITVRPGANPPSGRLAIGVNPVLQLHLEVGPVEATRLDEVTVRAASSGAPAALVDELTLHLDAAGAGTPAGDPLARIANPFTGGAEATFSGVALSVPAGGSAALLVVARVTDRLRQADTLGITLLDLRAAGVGSGIPARVTLAGPITSRLAAASLLEPGEVFLVSENPVRSGRLIFSYATPPRAVTVYTLAGRRVRAFTRLPPNRFEWDLRSESPRLPNGMYLLLVDTGAELLRRRLLILSPGP